MIDFEEAPSSSGKSIFGDFTFSYSREDSNREPKEPLSINTPRDQLPNYLQTLNAPQLEAALTTEGPLIVLAGAGSGKTKMLTARVAYLVGHLGIPAHQILAVTFTNKAANEMRERVNASLRASDQLNFGTPEIGTFHSVCVRILRREMDHLPFDRPFVIYDDSDQLTLVKSVMRSLNIDPKNFNPKAVQASINGFKCEAVGPEEIEPNKFNAFEKVVQKVFTQYQKELFQNSAVDFGEIICMTYRLFRDNPSVKEKYQNRYRYVHVDEYQDTNRSQYLLLSMLASPQHGGHQNICVVGDEDQSIYKWRGADIHNILDFEKEYPTAKLIKLEQNYRSTKTIIEGAGHVIKNNTERKDKTLWTDNARGVKIVVSKVPDEKVEAELVVSEIGRLVRQEGLRYDDFAIFYRTHAQSRQFEDVLNREKLPYQVVGGLRFYDRKEIKDILAYFRFVMNPSDSVSLMRVINVPARGIGKTTIEKLAMFASQGFGAEASEANQAELGIGEVKTDMWAVLKTVAQKGSKHLPARARTKLAEFVEMIERLREKQQNAPLSEFYHHVLDETGYVQQLKRENTVEADTRIENLEEFDSLIQEFEEELTSKSILEFKAILDTIDPKLAQDLADVSEEDRDRTWDIMKSKLLPIFIEQTSLVTDANKGNDPNSVKMMTLHSSKGLEFPVVFVVGLEEGLFPSIKLWEEIEPEEIEEERRLCYVGMTRAKERLYLTHATVRRIWGNIHYQDPARFLDEIPEEYLEVHDFSQKMGFSRQRDKFQPQKKKRNDFEFDQRKETATPSLSGFIGASVQHPTHGKGKIVSLDGNQPTSKATVDFGGRKRKFIFRFLQDYIKLN